MGETNVLFSIGPLEVTGAVVTMWVIVAVLALLSWLATRRLRDVPGPLQNAAEMAVEKLQGFYGGILGPANARRYFPMMATFFIFIVVSNYIGLLPGAGEVFTVPTATLSVTAGLAIIARSAEALGWTESPIAARISACLAKNNLPTGTEYTAEALAAAALADKKRAGGDITLVIPRRIGLCELKKVPVTELLPIIAAGVEG